MQRSFFVTEAALKKLQPNARRDETGLLRAFDANREKIYVAARRAYARERRKSYELGRFLTAPHRAGRLACRTVQDAI